MRYELYLLRRIRKYLPRDQAKLLYNAFINSLITPQLYGCFVERIYIYMYKNSKNSS